MDHRTDTLSGRFGGQWAFLSNPPVHHGHTPSLPPSSYLPRSDHSVLSPSPVVSGAYQFNASRSSLSRHYPTTSIAGCTSATHPSQPVLIRVHSADASAHVHPLPRGPRRRPIMTKNNELPPVSDFSISGILAAIQEDIEGDIDAISEILGRSRLTLADQHESHLPPQGEIRAALRPLQGIAEASSSNERLAADDVLILAEDASLVDGSHAGSTAYGLLERLQAIPRVRRLRSDGPAATAEGDPRLASSRTHSSPAVLLEVTLSPTFAQSSQPIRSPRAPRFLLPTRTFPDPGALSPPRTTNPVVSETYLSAGANGRTATNPPVVSEAGRHYPLYSYDESDLFEGVPEPVSPSKLMSFRSRLQNLMVASDLSSFTSWLTHQDRSESRTSQGAEGRLRDILERSYELGAEERDLEPEEDENMYE